MPGTKAHNKRSILRPKKTSKEFVIWCDESDIKNKYCSNFYGGVLVKSEDLKEVQERLGVVCNKLRFFDELKWQKVSQHYLDKYAKVMDEFFLLMNLFSVF